MDLTRLNRRDLWIAADTETDGFEAAYDGNRVMHCMQVCIDGKAYVLRERTDIQYVLDNYVTCWVNAKFDIGVLRAHGYSVTDYHDIAVANYSLIGARSSENNSLNAMALHYLGKQKLEKPRDWAVFDEQAEEYAKQDVLLTDGLLDKVLTALQQMPHAWEMYVNIDLPNIEPLVEMHTNGVYIDANVLRPLIPVYETHIEDVVNEHTKLYGFKRGKIDNTSGVLKVGGMPMIVETVNGKRVNRRAKCDLEPRALRGSDRQWVLNKYYPHLVPHMPRTADGRIKTDKHTLATIAELCPAAELWMEYETRTKQLGTFLLPLIEQSSANSVIRASLHNYNTRTGRLSCSSPNMQQVPAQGERGEEVRRAFTAPPGYKVVVGDLDRIELVVLAFYLRELLGEDKLYKRIISGDVHQQNADAWMCVRDAAKRGVFCIVYGGGATKLALVLKSPVDVARQTLSAINNDLCLEAYRNFYVEQGARNDGYINNYFGRRLYIPELVSDDKSERASGRRKAGNYPIQSTAGDVFKYMQNNALRERVKHGLVGDVAWQALVVHDEIIYIVREERVDEFVQVVTPCYNSVDVFAGIPVSLTFGVGDSWYEAKKAGG